MRCSSGFAVEPPSSSSIASIACDIWTVMESKKLSSNLTRLMSTEIPSSRSATRWSQ
ncbi:MAG: hypothetical protein ACYTGY_10650 [Planctomycetota bacterium]